MEEKKYKFSIKEPLQNGDTENTTFGCRCNNPDICSNCGLPCCGLYNDTHICTKPSRAWKKIYMEKIKEEGSKND